MFWSHPAENGSPPALQSHIQSHIQSKMADLQPSSHVREKSGAICKIRAKYIQRVQRALSPCRSENHIQNHIHGKFRGLKSHLITSGSHPRVTSGQISEASHIRVVTSAITSGQNPVTSRSQPYRRAAGRRAWHAGVSSLNDRDRVNDFSVGIELVGSDDTEFEAKHVRSYKNRR